MRIQPGPTGDRLSLTDNKDFLRLWIAQAVSAIEESGRVAKETLAATEQFTAQWRKSAQDAAQRTVELFTPKA